MRKFMLALFTCLLAAPVAAQMISDEGVFTGAAVVPVATSWNAADKNNVTLTGSNLIATAGTGSGGVRGVASKASGKYCWEQTYTLVNTNSIATGIALATADVTGATTTGIAFIARLTGEVIVSGVGSGVAFGTIAQGAVIGTCADFAAKLIWFRVAPAGNWNASGTANPATGIGGVDISTIGSGPLFPIFFGQSGDKITSNFGGSAFSGAVPSGFASGFLGP